MKICFCVQLGRVVAGQKAGFQWSFEPARQSGLDIATNLKLLELTTRGRLFAFSIPPGYISLDVPSQPADSLGRGKVLSRCLISPVLFSGQENGIQDSKHRTDSIGGRERTAGSGEQSDTNPKSDFPGADAGRARRRSTPARPSPPDNSRPWKNKK